MKSLYEIQRVRYPPFEASRWIPEALPVATKRIHLGDFATEDDVLAAHGEHGPTFMIGKEDAWLLERRYEYGGRPSNLGSHKDVLNGDPFVPLVKRQRRGWYLIPNPIHNILRAFIRAVVVVLLASLFYLFVSPLLLFIGLPVYGLNTIRWGLLDYPALAVFVVPLIFAPLFIRVLANLVELRRQQHFLNKNPPPLRFNSMNRPMQTSHSKSTSSFRIGLKPGTMSMCFGEWVCFHLRGKPCLRNLGEQATGNLRLDFQRNCRTTGKSDWTMELQVEKMHPWKFKRQKVDCTSVQCESWQTEKVNVGRKAKRSFSRPQAVHGPVQ